MEQKLFQDKLSVLFGLHDLNSEFYITASSLDFINPSYGIGPEFATAGSNGPSIFPTTSLAIRLKYLPTESIYIQVAAFDGVPGSLTNPYGTHIQFGSGEGILKVGEAGLHDIAFEQGKWSQLALGAWEYTVPFPDLTDVDLNDNPVLRKNRGTYMMAEYSFDKEPPKSGRSYTAFLRAGLSNGSINQIDKAFQAGITCKSPILSRAEDSAGVGIAWARTSYKWQIANPINTQGSETIYEGYYLAHVSEYISLQPDIQYVIQHQSLSLRNSALIGLRLIVAI